MKSFSEEEVMNFSNRWFSSPSICEYQTSEGDSNTMKKRTEPNPILGFKMDLSAFQKDQHQDTRPWNYKVMIQSPKPARPKIKQLSSLSHETGGNSKT